MKQREGWSGGECIAPDLQLIKVFVHNHVCSKGISLLALHRVCVRSHLDDAICHSSCAIGRLVIPPVIIGRSISLVRHGEAVTACTQSRLKNTNLTIEAILRVKLEGVLS